MAFGSVKRQRMFCWLCTLSAATTATKKRVKRNKCKMRRTPNKHTNKKTANETQVFLGLLVQSTRPIRYYYRIVQHNIILKNKNTETELFFSIWFCVLAEWARLWEAHTEHRKQSNKHTIDVSIGYSGDIVSNANNRLIFVNVRKKNTFFLVSFVFCHQTNNKIR